MARQDYILKTVRSAAELTGSYVAGTVLGIEEVHGGLHNQVVLYVDLTLTSLTSAEIKVEFSDDNVTYFQETFASISGTTETDSLGEHTFTQAGKFRIPIPIKDNYIKISAKGTGTATGSSMAIYAVVGVA
jgi:hypothetical protein